MIRGRLRRHWALQRNFHCVSCYKCEEVCPAHIPIVSGSDRTAQGESRNAPAGNGEASPRVAAGRIGRGRVDRRARVARPGNCGLAQSAAPHAHARPAHVNSSVRSWDLKRRRQRRAPAAGALRNIPAWQNQETASGLPSLAHGFAVATHGRGSKRRARRRRGGVRAYLAFVGPAVVASIAYMIPGNFATNIQSGARYGYTLLWVVLVANLIAMLFQALSAKLGIVTGRNLAEMCREQFPQPVVLRHVGRERDCRDGYRPRGVPRRRYRAVSVMFGLPLLSAW